MVKPWGVCIQEFTAMIQVALIRVPVATRQDAMKCKPAPDAMHAEQHDAEEAGLQEEGGEQPRSPSTGPTTGPALSAKFAQLVPNS